MAAHQDPWKIAAGLIALVGILAFLFPKPERIDPHEDPEHALHAPPPPGSALGSLTTLSDIRCVRVGRDEQRPDCRLLGTEGDMAYHLAVQWDVTDWHSDAIHYTVTDAYLELSENHEAHYTGPVHLHPIPQPGGASQALQTPPLASGARISPRIIRLPAEGESTDLNALVAGWLNRETPNLGVIIATDPDADSSVDEFTPVLNFYYKKTEISPPPAE